MQERERNRLAAIISQMSITLPKDLDAAAFNAQGQKVNLVDIYERVLEGYGIDGIERACWAIIKAEKFFPSPAVIIKYYNNYPPVGSFERDELDKVEIEHKNQPSLENKTRRHLK